jgi:hypothetical protein
MGDMTLRRIIRASALLLLTMMMLVRMGPLCESLAMAAVPTTGHVVMTDCDRPAPTRRTDGKTIIGACAGACLATEADRQSVAAGPVSRPACPVAASYAPLENLSGGPAPPPPRTA